MLVNMSYIIWTKQKGPSKLMEGPFSMYTDTVTIYTARA
jgi:hypothetical protein